MNPPLHPSFEFGDGPFLVVEPFYFIAPRPETAEVHADPRAFKRATKEFPDGKAEVVLVFTDRDLAEQFMHECFGPMAGHLKATAPPTMQILGAVLEHLRRLGDTHLGINMGKESFRTAPIDLVLEGMRRAKII